MQNTVSLLTIISAESYSFTMHCVRRLTAPIAGDEPDSTKEQAKEGMNKAKHAADGKAQDVADSSRTTYEKIKSSLGSFMGTTKREATETKDKAAEAT